MRSGSSSEERRNMTDNQIFEILSGPKFERSARTLEGREGSYDIRTYEGGHVCMLGVSTAVDEKMDSGIIDALNRDAFPFRYSMKDGRLLCSALIWTCAGEKRKAMDELAAVLACSLECARKAMTDEGR